MFKIILGLLRFDSRFRVAFVFLLGIVLMALLSLAAPAGALRSFSAEIDQPPSVAYIFGTTTRGQNLFWWMTFAVRNSLLFGLITAVLSRAIAIMIGLTAGYRGGFIDRFLMSINDSFVIMPVLPVLILLSFLIKGQTSLFVLPLMLAVFGWAWDARLIRALALSLKERSFTRTAVYSGTKAFRITMKEHLPFVLPVVFSTSINNMIWAIGMEVTLGILGLSNVTLPTLGSTIYWANQHQALVAGIWWWLIAPVATAIFLFLGLYFLFSSVNEYIDPRTRLRRMGG
jgi:peptide/nickel transport system permease protein